MSERSVEVFKSYEEGEDKFDYFVCGVAGALFTYVGQTYTPQKLTHWFNAFEPIALLLLATSFFVGLRRIEAVLTMKRINHKFLHASEGAGYMTKALAESSPSALHYTEGGQIRNTQQIEAERKRQMTIAKECETVLSQQRIKVRSLYKLRNNLLILGFIAIFCAKISQPYLPSGTPIKTKTAVAASAPRR